MDAIDMMEMGRRIKERRLEIRMSSQDLADRIGLNKATLYRYESGIFQSVKLPIVESIANALRVNPSWLIGKSDDKFCMDNLLSTQNTDGDKDILNIINTTADLLKQDGLMFGGNPIDKESIQSILDAMEIGLELAKKKIANKKG